MPNPILYSCTRLKLTCVPQSRNLRGQSSKYEHQYRTHESEQTSPKPVSLWEPEASSCGSHLLLPLEDDFTVCRRTAGVFNHCFQVVTKEGKVHEQVFMLTV